MNPAPSLEHASRGTNEKEQQKLEKHTKGNNQQSASQSSKMVNVERTSQQYRSLLDCPSEIIAQIVSYLDTGHDIEAYPANRHFWVQGAGPPAQLCLPQIPLLALSWSCKILYSYARPLLCKYSDDLKNFYELSAQSQTYVRVLSTQYGDKGSVDADPTSKVSKFKSARDDVVRELLEMERWPAYDPVGMSEAAVGWAFNVKEQNTKLERFSWKSKHQNLFVCTSCLRFRPVNKFIISQVTGRRAKRPKSSKAAHQAHERFCIDCGINKNRSYNKGILYRIFEKDVSDRPSWGLICVRCGKWKVCEQGRDGKEATNKMCQECLDYRPKGRQNSPSVDFVEGAVASSQKTPSP